MRKFLLDRKYQKEAIVIIIFAIASFVFLTQSALHPWKGTNIHTDSAVFKTMSMMMRKGYIPYKDTFDHKGPLLYLINYLGDLISPYRGVWVLEYIFLIITLFFMRKIALLSKCSEIQAVASVFFAAALLYSYFDGGNMTEEYAMPFIAISLYYFLDYFLNDRITKLRLMFCGFCFGCVLMLRANMIATWLVFCVAVLMYSIIDKKWDRILEFTCWFTVGTIVAVVPFLAWLGMNHAIRDFWFSYIVFNKIYSTSEGGMATLIEKGKTFLFFVKTPIYEATIVSGIYLMIKKKEKIFFIYFVFLILNLITVAMSGLQFGHYGMTMVPTVPFLISNILVCINQIERNQKLYSAILLGGTIVIAILGGWKNVFADFSMSYEKRNDANVSNTVAGLSEIIKENTSADEKISVYGNYDILYVVSGREHATKYSYQIPIGNVYKGIQEEYFEQLREEKPKLIIVQKGRLSDEIQSFIEENCYELLWADDMDDLQACYPVFIRR